MLLHGLKDSGTGLKSVRRDPGNAAWICPVDILLLLDEWESARGSSLQALSGQYLRSHGRFAVGVSFFYKTRFAVVDRDPICLFYIKIYRLACLLHGCKQLKLRSDRHR